MTNQVNQRAIAPANLNRNATAMRVQDFTQMNSLEFHDSKVDEDPLDFIDKV